MAQLRRSAVFFNSFLDGFTMAGLFTRWREPGAPTPRFADPDLDDVHAPGEPESAVAVSSSENPIAEFVSRIRSAMGS